MVLLCIEYTLSQLYTILILILILFTIIYVAGSSLPYVYTTYEDRCGLPSAVLEFFEIASEGWFICLAVDLAITISNPFSSFKDRLSKYHIFSWCFGGVMSLILGASKDLHGFWYVTPEIDNNTFCWIKSHRSDSDKIVINYRPWLMFYIPLLVVYMYAVVALYIAYKRLQTGISKTFH